MIISNGYLLHLVLLDGLAQQSKHATAKDGDYDEDDSFVIVNCEQIKVLRIRDLFQVFL